MASISTGLANYLSHARRTNKETEHEITHLNQKVDAINQAGKSYATKSDTWLKEKGAQMSSRLLADTKDEAVLIELFALGREAADRMLGMRPFDVQMLAGLALKEGHLIEMNTGEGKTLAAVLPACFQAFKRKGVHILTFNDYLARRDAAWMKPLYTFFGLSVGVIQEGQSAAERKAAYGKDVTYATAKEVGFDFLRQQLVRHPKNLVLRPLYSAIVDEADSILIDEARTPLVIAGERNVSDTDPYRIADIVSSLQKNIDWETDAHERNVLLTECGVEQVEALLKCGSLYADENFLLLTEVNQALHALALLHRDVDYIVRNNRIEIVDEFTGRVMEDRRWPDGLQAALEAKEKLSIQPGGKILGSITVQHFLKQYEHMAGMTATALTAAEELDAFYGLKVVPISPNLPCRRIDEPSLIYRTKDAKYRALVDDIKNWHHQGRPVLVGTISVAESEQIGKQLALAGVPCRMLNAKNDEAEAAVIARAGEPGAVTISTNMAGRGTDIKLGGVDEAERGRVLNLGGLVVIGTNQHESVRIDHQLRGRAGRQGDPGASRFYLSLEDKLLMRFGIDTLIPKQLWPRIGDAPIEHSSIRREVERVQRIVEGQNYEIRQTLWKYAQLMEAQRQKIQNWRSRILEGTEVLTLFEKHLPLKFAAFEQMVGFKRLHEIERVLTLHHMDHCWSAHLARVSQLREGIHLVGIGGMNPINEYHKQLAALFWNLLEEIEAETLVSLSRLELNEQGINLGEQIENGPSSTWTYLINDQALTDIQNVLFGPGSSAYAAGAVLMAWPLLLAWGLWHRWKRKR